MIRKSIVLVAFLLCGVAAPASWLVRGVEPLVVKSFGTEISYFSADVVAGDLATKTQKTFQLSDEEVRWLKTNSKKGDFRKLLASSQSELAQEIEARVQAHQPLSLLVQTTEPADRFVVQIDFDSNDRLECAVYARAAVCPVWIAKSVAASLALALNGGKKGMSGLAKVAGTVLVGSAMWYGLMGEKNNAGNQSAGTPPGGATVPKSDQLKSNPAGGDAPGTGLERRAGTPAPSEAGLQVCGKLISAEELKANREAASHIIDDALRAYRLPCADVKDATVLALKKGEEGSLPVFPGDNIGGQDPNDYDEIVKGLYLGGSQFTDAVLLSGKEGRVMPEKVFDLVIAVAAEKNTCKVKNGSAASDERAHWAPFSTCLPEEHYMKIRGVDYLFYPMHEGMCYLVDNCKKGIAKKTAPNPLDWYRDLDVDAFHEEFLPNSDLIFSALDMAIANNQSVLVHCSNGSHRSASVLFAYIASRVPIASCWKINCFLRSKRSAVKPAKDSLGWDSKLNMMNKAMRHYAAVRIGAPCSGCGPSA